MIINKSNLLKQLSDSFPNFFRKDLLKLVDITLDKIRTSLLNDERVELRDTFVLEAKKYKSKYARNQKTNEKIYIPEKKILRFKMSKKWQNKINEKD